MAFDSLQQAVIPRFNSPTLKAKLEGPLPSMGRAKSKSGKYVQLFLARVSPGVMFFASGYNNSGAIRYIQIHDLDTDIIANGNMPDAVIPVGIGQYWSFDAGAAGLPMGKGILIVPSANAIAYDSTGMAADQWMMCVHNDMA